MGCSIAMMFFAAELTELPNSRASSDGKLFLPLAMRFSDGVFLFLEIRDLTLGLYVIFILYIEHSGG